MPTLEYDQVFSRFFKKAEAYDLTNELVSDDMADEFLCDWLRQSVYYPYIRKFFNTVAMDDSKRIITYTMQYAIDDDTDNEFVTELLAYNMVLDWLEPKVNSLNYTQQHYGSSDEKWYSQQAQLEALINLQESISVSVKKIARDRETAWNDYLDGNSSSANLRS